MALHKNNQETWLHEQCQIGSTWSTTEQHQSMPGNIWCHQGQAGECRLTLAYHPCPKEHELPLVDHQTTPSMFQQGVSCRFECCNTACHLCHRRSHHLCDIWSFDVLQLVVLWIRLKFLLEHVRFLQCSQCVIGACNHILAAASSITHSHIWISISVGILHQSPTVVIS